MNKKRSLIGTNCRALGAVIAIGLLAMGSAALGQGNAVVGTFTLDADETSNNINQPFLLGVMPSDVQESIQDYRRYVQRSQWEKAFKQLEKLSSADAKGLVPDTGGILVPPAVLLQRLLGQLPEEGKKAYRLFHDAEAKSLLDHAQGKNEEQDLTALATRYLFTTSGGAAADRLGDLLFERGEFARAVQSWRTILRFPADSNIPAAQLLVKIAIALAHDQRWEEFENTRRLVDDRYADATVTLGGKSSSAREHLAKLAAARPKDIAADQQDVVKLQIDPDCKPRWQFRWFAEDRPAGGNRKGVMAYDQMYGRQYLSDYVPPVVADDARVYSNYAGYDVGIDLQTGKLLWRNGRFFDLPQKFGQNNGQNQFLEQTGLVCTSDRLWGVSRDPASIAKNNNNSNDNRFVLVSRELPTGKETKVIRDWTMMGAPAVDDSHLYVAAYKPNQASELHALALNRADGKQVWDIRIGTYKVDPRQQPYQMGRCCVPTMLPWAGKLFVNTQAGSLVEMNPATGEIGWGLNYDAEIVNNEYRYYGQMPERDTVCMPMVVDGVLYLKGMRSRRLYAIDPDEPKVLWSRPVARTAILCGVDKDRVYMGGEEITAYDLKTRQLLWSKPAPIGTSWVRPLLSDDRIYQFTSRGIYEIDKATGDVVQLFRGADMDSLGGALLLAPHNTLLAVSNLAITAYPLKSAAAGKTEKTASQPGDSPTNR
jgi:outer membrane protein assembly factor BamB